jgi:hypothetical protein
MPDKLPGDIVVTRNADGKIRSIMRREETEDGGIDWREMISKDQVWITKEMDDTFTNQDTGEVTTAKDFV